MAMAGNSILRHGWSGGGEQGARKQPGRSSLKIEPVTLYLERRATA